MPKKVVYPNKPLRAVMDRYQIRVIEWGDKEFRENVIPEDFRYRGGIVEVRMGEQAVFCRFEGLGATQFYEKKNLLPRFPDWEGWLINVLIGEAEEARWYREHHGDDSVLCSGGMAGWLYAYGKYKKPSQNYREWEYACRVMDDLEKLFGETILKEIQDAISACDWDTDNLG